MDKYLQDAYSILRIRNDDFTLAYLFLQKLSELYDDNTNNLLYDNDNKQFYFWEGTHWNKITKEILKGKITNVLNAIVFEHPKPKDIGQTLEDLNKSLEEIKEHLKDIEDKKERKLFEDEIIKLTKAKEQLEKGEEATDYKSYNIFIYEKVQKKIFTLKSFISQIRNVNNIVSRLETISSIAVKADIFDGEVTDTKINLLNGTFDLEKNVFEEHNKNDYFTYCIKREYVQGAKSDIWQKYIDSLWADKKHEPVRKYIQAILGYCISGETSLKQYFNFYSKHPHSGKSTLVDIIQDLLGLDVMNPVSDNFFVEGNFSKAETIYNSKKRILVASEVSSKRNLAESFVNKLTGGDMVGDRILFTNIQNTTKPKSKLILHGNYLPSIDADNIATWTRVRVIPFPAQFTVVAGFKKQFVPEYSGIINWLIEGYQMYKNGALNEANIPEIIRKNVESYRKDNDSLSDWIEDCVEYNDDYGCKVRDAYESYKHYFTEGGLYDVTITYEEFKRKIEKKFGKATPKRVVNYQGVTRVVKGFRINPNKKDVNNIDEILSQVEPNKYEDIII